ncbi:MAG: hypothetical protein ACLU9S_10055 [Oscillospiraceae bacterium]
MLFTGGLRQAAPPLWRRCISSYRQRTHAKVKPAKSCSACSLKELCLPILRRRSNGGGLPCPGHGGYVMKQLLNTLL